MHNQLDFKITSKSLFLFALPSVLTMIIMNIYGVADGMFVARLIGTSALSAVNIVFPLIMLGTSLGLMLATGGNAIVARKLGEGREAEARQNFSLLVLVSLISGLLIAVLGLLILRPLLYFLGANDAIYHYCHDYAFYVLLFFPLSMLGIIFQVFFVTAGRASLAMVSNILGGIVNIVFDYIFIAKFNMGVSGAAIATSMGFVLSSAIGFFFFLIKRDETLYLVRPKMSFSMLLHSCGNGSSEMVSNLSQGVTLVLFNITLMRLAGEDGVAAITVLMYAKDLLIAAFMGYATGIAPIISYNYGKKDQTNLRRTQTISIRLIATASAAIFLLSLFFGKNLVTIFASNGSAVYQIAQEGFRVFSISFLFMGFSIYGSAMFTAFSNGRVSAIISFLRTFVFMIAAILILPRFFGLNGVWMALPAAEFLSILVTIYYVRRYHAVYFSPQETI